MKQTILAASALFLAGTSLFAADPQLLNMAPPDTQMFAGINVEQAKTSQFGQFLLMNLPSSADFQEFIGSTGFDPRTDLREVLIVTGTPSVSTTPGVGVSVHSGMLLAKGTFNISKILAAAATDAKATVSAYSSAQLVTIGKGEQSQALALIDGSTAVAGPVDDVKAALDRRSTGSVIPAAVMARINQLSTTEDIWSVSTANFGALAMPGSDQSGGGSAVLKSIQQASGGVKFGAQVQLDAQAVTASAQDATSLGDVVKLLSQMLEMHGSANPAPAGLVDLLKTMVVSTDSNILKVTLTIPESQLESLFKMAEQHGAAQKI